ncbi:MAG: Uma2 family endonuclease [Alphaproteobacteria bacterium]|nr:Uma2 family endonuclease [Alphaproteobacteria bacterium]
MTADAFIDRAMAQPTGRYELVAGEVVAMSPERAGRALVQADIREALKAAVGKAGLDCEVYPDGTSVVVDDATVYEPDALVRCGAPLDREAVRVPDPVVVVEVLSPATRAADLGGKLDGYFRLVSLRHDVICKTATRSVIHHRRDDAGDLRTAILTGGALALDPPGLRLDVEALFAGLCALATTAAE